MRTTIASFLQLDVSLPESSASLGAGAFLAFIASFDNVSISLLLADASSQVLPIRMWQMLQADLDVRVASISAVLIVLTLIVMTAMERMVGLSRQMVR